MNRQFDALKSKKILVTGGAGFVGANLVDALVKLGSIVTVLDNYSTGKEKNLNEVSDKIKLIQGDINDIDLVREALKDIDYILHQAAIPSVQRSVENPFPSNQVNISGTLNLLTVAKDYKIKRFVYAASSSAYGNTPVLPKIETMVPNPRSPYAITKYVGELYCQVFSELYNLETVSLRYFNVFGPKQDPNSQYSAVIPRFIRALINDQSPIIYGDGTQSRDFCFIENVVQANLLALVCSKTNGEVMNIACNQQTSLNELLKELNIIFKKNISPKYEAYRIGDVKDSLADITKAKKIINYEPKVFIKEGLARTINYFLNNS